MSDKANALADKLVLEGDRVLAFFRGLPGEAWAGQVYADGAHWSLRDVFEHLVISEAELNLLFERVAQVGEGVSADFDIDQFNRAHTGDLAALSLPGLFERYADTRRRTADLVRTLTDTNLATRARHPALGEAPLEAMVKLIYLHHTLHLRDIKRLRPG